MMTNFVAHLSPVIELEKKHSMFLGSNTNLIYSYLRNDVALGEYTPIFNVWRLPSLVCGHISYAAWCFSVTCFYNISLKRAWLTNGIDSLICPLLFLVWLFSLFLWPTWMIYHTEKQMVCSHCRGWGRQLGWLNDLSVYLLIEGGEQMLYSKEQNRNQIKAILVKCKKWCFS